MDLGLAGRTAVVTGGSRGIGLAIVRALADNGVSVVTGAKTLSAEVAELASGGQVRVIEIDLAEPSGPGRLAGLAGERIDILVNNVGVARRGVAGSLASSTTTGLPPSTWIDGCRPHYPGRAGWHARSGPRFDHHRQLGERQAARPGSHGLQRGQGGPWPASAKPLPDPSTFVSWSGSLSLRRGGPRLTGSRPAAVRG